VGCGILEALFYYILVADGKASRTEWQSVSKIKSPEFEINGNKYRTDLEHFVKLAVPALDQMTFDAMCKRVEKRDLAKLGTDKFYKHLPFLRSLWNRVHIHDVDCMQDTDWIKFERKDFNLVKQVLFLLLQSPSFPIKNTDIFYFLKV
jgi:hypothetical protein